MKWLLMSFLLPLLLTVQVQAAIDTYEFRDEASRERFRQLTEELRCPKCQNQNLADSNSPIAKDLRTEVHRMLGENQSDDEIVDFMVARYGEFVLYKPRKNASTWILWYGPFVLLGVGVAVLLFIARRKRRQPAGIDRADADNSEVELDSSTPSETAVGCLSAAEQQRLNELLQGDKK
ncbi:MAG: cytochrome c-type biogenesis protein CcmH [Marinobacterium sp.]|nr:cytochrome c-type biogenesis protein CcmH [Marinobacterium sp.]